MDETRIRLRHAAGRRNPRPADRLPRTARFLRRPRRAPQPGAERGRRLAGRHGARPRPRRRCGPRASGEIWGPLHGVPMTVKESFNVAGLPTTFGNPAVEGQYRDRQRGRWSIGCSAPARSSTARPTCRYMLQDSQSYNDIYGTTNNPWDVTRGPGGSSGGEAAALAAGLSALGAGSDIAGSLRNPAHYCGVYGHKPTWGLIPTRGHSPTGARDADRHLGGRPDGAPRRGSRPCAARPCRPRPAAAGGVAGRAAAAARAAGSASSGWRCGSTRRSAISTRACATCFDAAVDAIERAGAKVDRKAAAGDRRRRTPPPVHAAAARGDRVAAERRRFRRSRRIAAATWRPTT